VFKHLLVWLLLTLVTLGLAALFYPYHQARFILRHTTWWKE